MTWRPIGTAPRKSRVLILVEGARGPYVCVGQLRSDRTWHEDTAAMLAINGNVEAWQPLPSTDLTSSPIVEAMEFAECTHYGERLHATIVEAEIRGMRAGYLIAEDWLSYDDRDPDHGRHVLALAIHAIREGGGR